MKLLVVFFYVCLMVGLGWNLPDFSPGNRAVGPWVSAFAYGLIYFPAVSFI
jgi:SSS family solute:Na+ symporter